MESNETPIASISTDRLILTLLQELAARVEKLENKAGAYSNPLDEPIVSHKEKQSFEDSSLPNEKDDTTVTSIPTNVPVLWPKGAQDESVLVWYGQLLDYEAIASKLKTIERRLEDISSEPKICDSLQKLGGTVQAPADFRLKLTNYWAPSPEQASLLGETMKFLDTLREKKGSYFIRDFDSKGNQVEYEYGKAQKDCLDVPPVRRLPGPKREQEPAPWQRLM